MSKPKLQFISEDRWEFAFEMDDDRFSDDVSILVVNAMNQKEARKKATDFIKALVSAYGER